MPNFRTVVIAGLALGLLLLAYIAYRSSRPTGVDVLQAWGEAGALTEEDRQARRIDAQRGDMERRRIVERTIYDFAAKLDAERKHKDPNHYRDLYAAQKRESDTALLAASSLPAGADARAAARARAMAVDRCILRAGIQHMMFQNSHIRTVVDSALPKAIAKFDELCGRKPTAKELDRISAWGQGP